MRQIDIGKSAEIRELKHAQKETVSRADEVEPRTCWKTHPIRTSNRIPTPEVSLGRKLTLLMLPLIALPIAHPHPRQLLGIVSDSIFSDHGYPLGEPSEQSRVYALHRLAGPGIQGDGVGDLGWLAKVFPSCSLYVASSRRSDMAERVKQVDRGIIQACRMKEIVRRSETPSLLNYLLLFIGSAVVKTGIPI